VRDRLRAIPWSVLQGKPSRILHVRMTTFSNDAAMILAIETATDTCSVAVLDGDTVTAEAHLHQPRVHARRLTPLIEDVLRHADASRDAIDVIAVSKGPGSYTGLRIGMSTAKGWAEATGAPLIGVPTLEALAATLTPVVQPGDLVCALLDARRQEVYAAAYDVVEDGASASGDPDHAAIPPVLHLRADAAALEVGDLPAWLEPTPAAGTAGRGTCWLVGTGAAKSEAALRGAGYAVHSVPPPFGVPSAAWVARCARSRRVAGADPEGPTSEPAYLKAFQAG